MAPIVAATRLGKRYTLSGPRSGRERPILDSGGVQESEFWAVRDICFELPRGESLGIVGRNGAGKSTLLRLLAGTARPTEGRAEVFGRSACLLDLGVGFHPLETGRENAQTCLVLQAGLTRREAKGQMREVADFAGIGEYFDRPIRTYSDGMRLRLAFATIALLRPEILITDEILTVGDGVFQAKCSRWFDDLLGRGGTLVLCSHDLDSIKQICTTALWLDGGRVRALGEPRAVIRAYRESIGPADAQKDEGAGHVHALGSLAGLSYEVVGLELRDAAANEVREIPPQSTVVVTVDLEAAVGVPQVFVGITRADLTPIYGVASDMDGAKPERIGASRYRYRLEFTALPLVPGRYRLRAHALDETGTRLYDTVELYFTVAGTVREDDPLVSWSMSWEPVDEVDVAVS